MQQPHLLNFEEIDMTFPFNTTTLRVLSTLVCTSLAACGGGSGAATSGDSVTAAQSVSKGVVPAIETTSPVISPTAASPAVPVAASTNSSGSQAAAAATVAPATPSTAASPAVSVAAPNNTSSNGAAGAAAGAPATPPTAASPAVPVTAPNNTSSNGAAGTAAGAPATATGPTTSPSVDDSASSASSNYGNYLRPYAVNSLWNSRPVNPVFGTFVIPTSSYFPAISSGAYSTGVFLASSTDQPMTVVGTGSTATTTVGVADPDSGGNRVITIPRWPAGVLPATGTDGHADIVDPITNIIHSFWQLKQVNGQWRAALYSWSKLGGTGWGDPAHYYQGARAVGIPASAGLIRKSEIKDGLPTYPHALAMSLTFNGLSNGVSSPAYVFPATSADNSASANTGSIPQGALLMLPPDFDSSGIVNADLKKVVETLKLYGAYVVDRNTGTPFVIYVENGSDFNLMPKGWDNSIASQLDKIRAGLRQVVSAQTWVDGTGKPATDAINAQRTMNILSMRGPWSRQSGTSEATYDTSTQRLLFSATTTKTVHFNANNTGMTPAKWAAPVAGTYVKFTVRATGGATLRMQLGAGGVTTTDTGALSDGQSLRFLWPANGKFTLIAYSGTNGASSVKGELITSQ